MTSQKEFERESENVRRKTTVGEQSEVFDCIFRKNIRDIRRNHASPEMDSSSGTKWSLKLTATAETSAAATTSTTTTTRKITPQLQKYRKRENRK